MTDPNQSATEPSEGKTATPLTNALASSMREWITPDGPRVVMIGDAIKLVLHSRTLERENQSLRKAAGEFADLIDEVLRFSFIEPDSVVEKVESALAELRARLEETK